MEPPPGAPGAQPRTPPWSHRPAAGSSEAAALSPPTPERPLGYGGGWRSASELGAAASGPEAAPLLSARGSESQASVDCTPLSSQAWDLKAGSLPLPPMVAPAPTPAGPMPLPAPPEKRRLPLLRLLGICAVCFGYGMALTTYALITFPSEAMRFFPMKHDIALAGFLGLAGVAQLSGPAVGFFSDRCSSAHGRRRPFVIGSWAVLVPMVLLQWGSSGALERWGIHAIACYYISSLVGMLALCAMLTAAQGLIPDLVPPEQTGQANGVLVLMLGLGAASGFGVVVHFPRTPLYPVLLGVLSLGTLCTALADSSGPVDHSFVRRPWTWRQVRACYWVDHERYPDFYWLFVSRIFYYIGVSCQSFLQYYLRDWVRHNGVALTPADAKAYTAAAAFLAQVGGAALAIPVGQMSDRPGVGRKGPLCWACTGVAACQVLYSTCQDLYSVMVVAFAYGLCNGAALAATYALAMDCIPDKSQAAKWLAVWDVATFAGTSIGPLLCGPTLFFFPMSASERARAMQLSYRPNSHGGYVTVMLGSGLFVALSALIIRNRVVAGGTEQSMRRRLAAKDGPQLVLQHASA
eukprot:TRINITY_DN16042_c0_g1_i1.p1 TRINITY_DN16042_c0_g1~~TRINITY_DN16042_c0_g1_i1.p1  ORF type:complete len:578 (+),score=130.09 TRINITY_DN16042_c0_g1_i1:78-1811(+)